MYISIKVMIDNMTMNTFLEKMGIKYILMLIHLTTINCNRNQSKKMSLSMAKSHIKLESEIHLKAFNEHNVMYLNVSTSWNVIKYKFI